jgi:hypothetical protein
MPFCNEMDRGSKFAPHRKMADLRLVLSDKKPEKKTEKAEKRWN